MRRVIVAAWRDCLMSSNHSPRAWKQVGADAWRCDPWNVCGVTVQGKKSFELWKDGEPHVVARGGSFAEATAKAREMEGVR